MATIGFLHIAQSHVPTFDALVEQAAGGRIATVHVVAEDLLAAARAEKGFENQLAVHLDELVQQGADVIVCTCSTIAKLAVEIGVRGGLQVLRVDRPMAVQAVASGTRIAVLASLDAAVEPVLDLLRQVAAEQGRDVELHSVLVHDAWTLFEQGDQAGYLRMLADEVRPVLQDGDYDVLVLAQASSAGVAELLSDLPIKIMSSPEAAVQQAISMLP